MAIKNTIKTFGLLLFFTSGQIANGQINEEKALSKGREAIKLMDNSKVEESSLFCYL